MDAASNHPYTILRIKRKRTDEPLDALGMLLMPPFEAPSEHGVSRRVRGSQKEDERRP